VFTEYHEGDEIKEDVGRHETLVREMKNASKLLVGKSETPW
jgi:hypothetical protein